MFLTHRWAILTVPCTSVFFRQQALENLAERSDSQAIAALVNALRQTEKYGTPLASALRVLSAEFRNERMMRAEEKAARLPAIATQSSCAVILNEKGDA